MIAADNPADANTVKMLRDLMEAFVADPEPFTEWEAKFLASMWRRTCSGTDGTPVFGPYRLRQIIALYKRTLL